MESPRKTKKPGRASLMVDPSNWEQYSVTRFDEDIHRIIEKIERDRQWETGEWNPIPEEN